MASVHIFGDEDGSIYAVIPSGDLLWYKDLARDGTVNWANGGTGQKISLGQGWNVPHVFSGGDGILYLVADNGDLYWYKDLVQNGTASWANGGEGQVIGNGWNNFLHVFSGGDGIIYAVQPSGDLLWYKDLGRDGKANWANLGQGVKIGEGWTFE